MPLFILKNNKKGFTLIEMVVYVSIVSIIALVIVESIILTIRSNKSSFVEINLRNSGYSAMEAITREIKASDDVEILINGIELKQNGGNKNIMISTSSDSILNLYQGSSTPFLIGPLIPKNTSVKKLNFKKITTTKSKAVKFEIELETTMNGITKNERFYSTVILRGSYKNHDK